MKKIIYTLLLFPIVAFAQTTLPTLWNFSTPSIENPPLGWTTGLGTNGNLTYSGSQNSVGGDGIACRMDATGETLTIFFAENPGPLSYWLKGTGISPTPAFDGSFKIQQSVDGVVWTDIREFTTMNRTMTRYVDQPANSSRYIRFFYNQKISGSNVALDSVMLRQAPPCTCATIATKYKNAPVADGSTIVTDTQSVVQILLENKGSIDTLKIDSVRFLGSAANDFSVTQLPSSIAANTSSNLQIGFNPLSNGSRIAQMLIYSNDASKSPFTITIYAIGGLLASEPITQPSNFLIRNVKSYGMDISYQHPTPKPEQYLVLRKQSAISEVPVDGKTYQKGDYIGGAQVLYIGDDTTTIKPTFVFAGTTYHFKIFALNGPVGFENYLTTNAPSAQALTPLKMIGNYYSGLNSTASNFVSSLSSKIAAHDTVFYSLYIPRFLNPFIARDTIQGKKVVSCVYTDLKHVYNEPFLWWTGTNSGTLTREHTYAQSWMPTRSTPTWPSNDVGREFTEYNDLHNLFPAHQTSGNAVRSNLPFGEIVGTPTYVSPTGMGKKGLNASGVEVWEPKDDHKGDLARALFYMCTAYNGLRGNNWSLPTAQDQAVLKKWHFQDLPDNWEIARHEFIASLQNNRNPFIDSVNYACRINFSNMTWIANVGSCGIAEKSLVITYPVGGEIIEYSMPGGLDTIAKWQSAFVDSVKIDLYVDDTLFMNLGTHATTNGYALYDLSKIGVKTTKAKIKLTAPSDNIVSMSPDYFTFRMTLGLTEKNLMHVFNIYPNPSKGKLHITSDTKENYSIHLTDLLGKTIIQTSDLAGDLDLNISHNGIYFLFIQSGEKQIKHKILIIE
jgi:hypothetical protein